MDFNQITPSGDQPISSGELRNEIQRSEGPEETEEYRSPEDLVSDTGSDNRRVDVQIRDSNKKTQKGKEKPSWVRKFQDFLDFD